MLKFTDITKLNYNFAGIYKIINIVNDKVYIGQSSCLYKRFYEYRRCNKRLSQHLIHSFNKYGQDSFRVEIIEKIEDLNTLNDREQYWIDYYQSYNDKNGYNICKYVKQTTLGRIRPKEEIERMKQSLPDRKGENNSFFGKKHSEDSKKLMKNAKLGNKLSEEHINKFCLKGAESVKKKIIQKDMKNGEIVAIYDSIRDAAKSLNISPSTIVGVLKKYPNRHTAGGFKWEYV
jgi:group I intron endonuclease